MKMYKILKTYATRNNQNNPIVCLQVGEAVFELSIVEARQLGIGIITTAEKAQIFQRVEDSLTVNVGQEEAQVLVNDIQQALEGEQ